MSLDVGGDDEDAPLSLLSILPDTGNTPEDHYFKELMWDAVNSALEELPEEQRAVFIMHEFEDKSFKRLEVQDIMRYVNQMPDGYRTVFNLYVIEGYAHREIADMLDGS